MEMEQNNLNLSLTAWLEAVHFDLCGQSNEDDDASFDEKVISVGVAILGESQRPTLGALCRQISDLIEHKVQLIPSKIYVVLHAMLICAVSTACEDRKLFVEAIIRLDQSHQETLMAAIRDNLECYASIENSLSQEEPQCSNCGVLQDTINSLQKTNLDLQQSMQETTISLKAEIAQATNKLVDTEVLVIEKERDLTASVQELALLRKQLEELELQCSSGSKQTELIKTMQDEIDMLRPLAAKYEVSEKQLLRLRERIEEMADLKQQLKAAFASHEETHEKLLAAEAEVDNLRKFRSQVDEYRQQQTETSIAMQEVTLRLQQKNAELATLSAQLSALTDESQGQNAQTQQLADELKTTSERLRNVERVGGVGESFSELNPALMQELQRLRSENESLQAKLDSTAINQLNRLERELADQTSINSSLHQKLIATSDLLKGAQAKIGSLQTELIVRADAFHSLQGILEEGMKLANEDILSLKHRHDHATSDMVDKHTSILNSLRESSKRTIEQTIDKARQEQEDQWNAFQEEKVNLEQKHAAEMADEMSKLRKLEAEIEEERNKRRRVERERKLFEADVYRLKTQLQVTGSSNGQEVDVALKEMKAMQAQLEEAQSELAILREAQGGSTSVDGFATDGRANKLSQPAIRGGLRSAGNRAILSGGGGGGGGGESTGLQGYLERSDLADKKMEQLQREKREMIARNLEENKDRIELSQKLLKSEREVATLKAKVTKLTLEKERLERKQQDSCAVRNENVCNGAFDEKYRIKL